MRGKTLDPGEVGSGTVESFLSLHGLATVTSIEPTAVVLCVNEPFHWNGSELVICSIGPVSWSGFEAVPVNVSLAVDTLRFEFAGTGSADRVVGVAPEYREQLVTYLGPEAGNAAADAAGSNADTHRLFLTPNWRTQHQP